MKLIFDTETTGFTQNSLPAEHPMQPYLVQLGFILAHDDGREAVAGELIVQPNGYEIPDQAANVHGISTDLAKRCGVPLLLVCAVFTNLRVKADELIAYNMDFDDLVMRAAIHRTGKIPANPGPLFNTCCMREVTPIIGLPPTPKMVAAGFTKNAPPKLSVAYEFFFKEEFANAHSALADARACARIYFHLKANNLLSTKVPF